MAALHQKGPADQLFGFSSGAATSKPRLAISWAGQHQIPSPAVALLATKPRPLPLPLRCGLEPGRLRALASSAWAPLHRLASPKPAARAPRSCLDPPVWAGPGRIFRSTACSIPAGFSSCGSLAPCLRLVAVVPGKCSTNHPQEPLFTRCSRWTRSTSQRLLFRLLQLLGHQDGGDATFAPIRDSSIRSEPYRKFVLLFIFGMR